MSSTNQQILQAKIDSRAAAIKNLDQVLDRENASRRLLRDQLTEHEVQMAERDESGTDHERWTTWASNRLAGMQMQLEESDTRIEKILGVIVGHEAAIKSFKAELEGSDGRPAFVYVSSAPAIEKLSRLAGKTVMDLERKPPSKKPGRRYVAKGERKKSAEPKPAKKDKRGRKAA